MKKDSFIKGTFIATFSIVIVKILGLVYVVPFYAIIGEQGGALYAYAYNIYSIFIAISSTGVPIAISKIISEYNTLGFLEAKIRAFKIGTKMVNVLSITFFIVLMAFAEGIAKIILGNLVGGNTIADVALAIRCISFAVLVVPYLSITKGYLQGHKYIKAGSTSQVIEQVVRIIIILIGSYVTIKVLNLSVSIGVSIAVTGAFFGGVAAIIYLHKKMHQNDAELGLKEKRERDNITDKEIFKKILYYTVPYIIINIAAQLYSFVDMVIIMRVLEHLNFEATTVEFITSAVTTWATKINMIINAFATGMTISLIPNIVSSFIKNDWKDVNHKINKAIEIILVTAIPITVGISFLATPVWTFFYSPSVIGSTVLRYSIFTALFSTLYLAVLSVLQGLNRFKAVYFTTLTGFLANALLDAPLMILFNKLGLPSYYGAITATVTGYTISILIALYSIKKIHTVSYKPFITVFFKTLIPTALMAISLIIMNKFLSFNTASKLSCLIFMGIEALIGGSIYLVSAYKMRIFDEIFGRAKLRVIIKKFTFGKVNIKD